jgi:hypothetical protein
MIFPGGYFYDPSLVGAFAFQLVTLVGFTIMQVGGTEKYKFAFIQKNYRQRNGNMVPFPGEYMPFMSIDDMFNDHLPGIELPFSFVTR